MRFHDERDKRLHPMRYSQIDASSRGKESFVIRRRETLGRRDIIFGHRSLKDWTRTTDVDRVVVARQCSRRRRPVGRSKSK